MRGTSEQKKNNYIIKLVEEEGSQMGEFLMFMSALGFSIRDIQKMKTSTIRTYIWEQQKQLNKLGEKAYNESSEKNEHNI